MSANLSPSISSAVHHPQQQTQTIIHDSSLLLFTSRTLLGVVLRVQRGRALIIRTFRYLPVLIRFAIWAADVLLLLVDLDAAALAAGVLCNPDETHYSLHATIRVFVVKGGGFKNCVSWQVEEFRSFFDDGGRGSIYFHTSIMTAQGSDLPSCSVLVALEGCDGTHSTPVTTVRNR